MLGSNFFVNVALKVTCFTFDFDKIYFEIIKKVAAVKSQRI